ncbi:hypothetical protein EDC40_104280 [Aminobacter aminovorans]|uniref:Uncharacterized protein n=1 Tax=Aminobacter aminovorans TaxID=83263 RepID=A0A380WGI6_AMIAI|nr:hypothetical protein [Aminobacter aminovorans]TCS26812.1 hypothetical protein EDC40_104280 [Aminobacter aminovorans]SUU88129.1 Uncharacterised protein [Aminobacter aminovorans]
MAGIPYEKSLKQSAPIEPERKIAERSAFGRRQQGQARINCERAMTARHRSVLHIQLTTVTTAGHPH